MWKNCLLKRRQWFCAICGDIVIPGFLFGILLLVRYYRKPIIVSDPTVFDIKSVYNLSNLTPDPEKYPPYHYMYTLGYSPAGTSSGVEERIMMRVKEKMKMLIDLHAMYCNDTNSTCITFNGITVCLAPVQ